MPRVTVPQLRSMRCIHSCSVSDRFPKGLHCFRGPLSMREDNAVPFTVALLWFALLAPCSVLQCNPAGAACLSDPPR